MPEDLTPDEQKSSEEYQRAIEEQRYYMAEIFMFRARFLFGLMLRDILKKSGISYKKWGKKAIEYDKSLKERGLRYPKSKAGYLGQVGIHRLITAETPPAYLQVFTFLRILEQEAGQEIDNELKTDLWHLAIFGSPEEVYRSYEKHKYLIDETSPEFIKVYEEHKRKMEEGREELEEGE